MINVSVSNFKYVQCAGINNLNHFKLIVKTAIEEAFKIANKSRNIHVHVIFNLNKDDMDDDDYYACIECGPVVNSYHTFILRINRLKISLPRLLKWLAHEVTHIKQYALKELQDTQKAIKWHGKEYLESDTVKYADYLSLPWEMEARSYEELLRERVRARLNLRWKKE